METFRALVEKRQSNRSYKPDKVPRELVLRCLEAARLAPSACNAQAWKFVVVDEPALREQLAEAANSIGMNKFAAQAPVIVAAVLEKPNMTSFLGSKIKSKDYTQIDMGIAIEHICLQAAELGLGSCIIGWFNEPKVRKLLHIPNNRRIPLLLTLGYANDEARIKKRKKLEDIHSFNTY